MPACIQHLAQTALNKALAQGRILRPTQCEMCGEPCKPQGYHHDYEQRFQVTWLCRKCHYGLHVAVRRGELTLFETRARALNYAAAARVKVSSSPSYTLREIEVAASEYLDSEGVDRFREDGKDLTPELLISNLIAWLAKREREGLNVDKKS